MDIFSSLYNKKSIEKFNYLDSILDFLVNKSAFYSCDIKPLFNGVYKTMKFDGNYESDFHKYLEKSEEKEFNDNTETNNLNLAIGYLLTENYITKNGETITLTYSGVLEHSKGGLSFKYKNEVKKNWLYKYNIIISILIAIFSFLSGVLFAVYK